MTKPKIALDIEVGAVEEVEKEERVLGKNERIMSVFSMWNRFFWQARSLEGKKGAKKFADKYHFLYKVQYFVDVKDSDPSAVELMYIQARHDLVESRYPCTEQDGFALGTQFFNTYNFSSASSILLKI